MVGGDSNTASEKYCRRKFVYIVISLALFFPSGAPELSQLQIISSVFFVVRERGRGRSS